MYKKCFFTPGQIANIAKANNKGLDGPVLKNFWAIEQGYPIYLLHPTNIVVYFIELLF